MLMAQHICGTKQPEHHLEKMLYGTIRAVRRELAAV